AAVLARGEHYRTGSSPCSVNEKWDCGVVNKSDYAVIGGLFQDTGPGAQPGILKRKLPGIANIPVADVGIAGYLLLALLAFKRWWYALAAASVVALSFSLYLAHIEKDVLDVWCIYCVISLGAISLITLLALGTATTQLVRKPKPAQ
ncbi:MAG TPA: vitamin K epoxide reductase family protein, partial [Candidatus Sulfotelmatobacter sp.]|nr:vitamin K epoxide reductase family protein [Candidatus Sulfotelmatobacter sp.]